jgi:outer membrane receptor for ferrienterochelin and colicins
MKPWCQFVVAGLLSTVVTSAGAEGTEELESLLQDPLVSTASNSASEASVAPATTVSITAQELREHGIRTLDEAIDFLSMGMNTEPNMHGVEIGARGVAINADYGNHVLLMLNGLALNEPWNGTAYFERGAGVPLEMIDRIEVMMGPASVLYGSNAMLGVVNVITKRAKDYAGLRFIVQGELSAPLGEGYRLRSPTEKGYLSDLGKGHRFAAGFGKVSTWMGEPLDVTWQLEWYRFDGASIEFAEQDYGLDSVTGEPKRFGPGPGTGVWGGKATRSWYAEAPVGYARVVWGEFTLALRTGWYERSAPYSDALVRYFGDFDPGGSYEKDTFFDAELQWEKRLSRSLGVSARVYAQGNRYQWFVQSSAPEDCRSWQTECLHDLEGIGQRLGAEMKTVFAWHDPWRMNTMLGVTGQLRHVEARTIVRSPSGDSAPIGPLHTDDVQGAVYWEHTARPASWLDANIGARLDGDERFGTAVSPRAAAAASMWSGATLRTIYAQAFRAPTPYEVTYYDPIGQIPAPDLSAETTRSIETSFEQRFGPHRVFFGAFRTWWDDMVVAETLTEEEVAAQVGAGIIEPSVTDVIQYRNQGHIDSTGFHMASRLVTLDSRLRFDASLTSALTRVHSEDGVGAPTVTPRFFGNARVAFDLGDRLPTVGLAAKVRAQRLADRYYDGGFDPAPTVPASVDLRLSLSGGLPWVAGMHYRTSVTWSSARTAPYVIGPSQYASEENAKAYLQPVDQLRGFAELEYRLPL